MKLFWKKFAFLGLVSLLLLGVTGCVKPEATDAEKVAAVLETIDLGDLTNVTADITLPTPTTDGVTVTWATSNAEYITAAGVVTIPTFTQGNQTVTLTVTVSLNDASDTKTFTATVTSETATAFFTRVGNAIIIDGSDQITESFLLPGTSLGATVTWESSNTDIAVISEEVNGDGFYVVTITRPQADDGGVNTTVTLTATLTYGSATGTATKTIRVMAEESSTKVTTIADGLALGTGVYVTYQGVTVLGKGTDGFFFTDGDMILFVYAPTLLSSIEAGSVYDITGELAYYYFGPQLATVGTNVVKVAASTAAVSTFTPIAATVAQAINNHLPLPNDGNPMVYTIYSLTAKVYVDESKGNYGVYLVPTDYDTSVTLDVSVTPAIRIYYKSNMAAVAALKDQVVTLDLLMYNYHTSYGDWYSYFFGTADDIEVTFANDQDAIDAAFNSLDIPSDIVSATTLTLPGSLYGVTLTYASNNEAVVNSTTGAVDLTGLTNQITVTLTVTATRGTTTDTETFTIKVGETPLSTIAEVLAMSVSGQIVKIQGVVFATYQTGYFVFDGTGLFQIYTVPSGFVLGDELVITGTLAAYKGEAQLTGATYQIVSSGNDYAQTALPYVPGVTALVAGQTYTVVGQVFWGKATPTGYDNLYIKDAAGTIILQVYYKSLQVPYDALKAMDGTTVILDAIYYNNKTAANLYDVVWIYDGVNQAAAAATEAQIVAFDKGILSIDTSVTGNSDATLPLAGFAGSVITWDVTGVTGATYDAGTGAITYPDVTVTTDFTLVATITKGATSDTLSFTVTVTAMTDAEKLAADLADLTVALTANEFDSVTLPAAGLYGSAITWALDSGNATLDGTALKFNLNNAAYDVQITATLTIGSETAVTKTFTIAVSAIDIVSDLSTLTAKTETTWTIANNTYVYVKAIVTGIAYGGTFVQDASGNGFFLYGLKTGFVVGDEIVVYGQLAEYRSARQLSGGVLKAVLTNGNSVITETLTADQVIALTYADCGTVIKITGLEVYSYTSTVAIFKVNGTSSVQYLRLYFNDFAPWLDEVYPVGSILPELQFTFYNIYTTNIANPGDTFNIDMFNLPVTDAQLITVALSSLSFPTAITEGTTLTLPTSYAGVTLAWASNNETVINPTTGVVDLSTLTTQVTVTLTVTATYGSDSQTGTITIKVGTVPLSTIAEAQAIATGTVIRIQGILIAQTKSSALWIQDATGGMNVYAATTDEQNQLISLVGQEIELTGTKDLYNGLFEIKTITSVVVLNATPTPIVPADVSAVSFDSTGLLPYQGELVSFTGFILKATVTATSGSVNFVLVNPVTGQEITCRLESTLPTYAATLAQIKTFVAGDAINVVGAVVGWYNGPQIAVVGAANFVAGTAIADQVMADYELSKVTAPAATASANFTLDITALFGATISWGSDNAAIAIDGAAATVTQPASGQPDASVTLTVTVTFGTATATNTYTVTVPAETGVTPTLPTDLFISEYIEGSSSNKALEIYNGTGADVDLSTYVIEVYTNGATTVTYTLTLSGTLVNGDVYVVYNASANAAIIAVGDVSSNVTYYNGDDAIVLKHNGTIIDSIGQVGVDPGTNWTANSVATSEMTLVRKAGTLTGDTDPTNAYDPSVYWDAYAQDTTTYLGSHTN